MGLRLVPKSMTLNDLERRNGHCQVSRAEMTQDQTWLCIRMNILVRPASAVMLTELLFFLQTIFLCLVAYDKLRSVNEHDDDDDDKFTAKSFAGAYMYIRTDAMSTRRVVSFGRG